MLARLYTSACLSRCLHALSCILSLSSSACQRAAHLPYVTCVGVIPADSGTTQSSKGSHISASMWDVPWSPFRATASAACKLYYRPLPLHFVTLHHERASFLPDLLHITTTAQLFLPAWRNSHVKYCGEKLKSPQNTEANALFNRCQWHVMSRRSSS